MSMTHLFSILIGLHTAYTSVSQTFLFHRPFSLSTHCCHPQTW